VLLATAVFGCAGVRNEVVPTDIPPVPDAAQLLLYRPPDAALGAGTAVVTVDGVEVASLGRSEYKLVKLSPGMKSMTVSGGLLSGQNKVSFQAKQGEIYRLAVRLRAEASKSLSVGGPKLQVLEDNGTFSFFKM